MLLAELVEVSQWVAETSARLAKLDLLAVLLRHLPPDEITIGIGFLSGMPRQGRIGIGPRMLVVARSQARSNDFGLTLTSVDTTLNRIKPMRGRGSGERKSAALRELLAHASEAEQDFLNRLLLGELRQGALAALVLEALARATSLNAADLRHAVMVAGGLGEVAYAALTAGAAGLEQFALRPFQPVQPMLAQPAKDVADVLDRCREAAFEYKFDGARIQAHKRGTRVQIYSRQLRDVTGALPEIEEAVRALPADELILDGEAIALDADERPRPFQVTMRRFGRCDEVESLRAELPLAAFFFDILHLNGEMLISRDTAERYKHLERIVPQRMRPMRIVTSAPEQAEEFSQAARRSGHEGVMAKALDAPYAAGRRGGAWLKIKPVHTLDLVILAAEWGSGRRRGWLSNLHLGARVGTDFVMLGKTFKGLTDKMLEWQTQKLLELEREREGYTVYVRPELVVEIAFNDVQTSPQYPGGLALRFARVKRYRMDKSAEQADSVAAVRDIHRQMFGV